MKTTNSRIQSHFLFSYICSVPPPHLLLLEVCLMCVRRACTFASCIYAWARAGKKIRTEHYLSQEWFAAAATISQVVVGNAKIRRCRQDEHSISIQFNLFFSSPFARWTRSHSHVWRSHVSSVGILIPFLDHLMFYSLKRKRFDLSSGSSIRRHTHRDCGVDDTMSIVAHLNSHRSSIVVVVVAVVAFFRNWCPEWTYVFITFSLLISTLSIN